MNFWNLMKKTRENKELCQKKVDFWASLYEVCGLYKCLLNVQLREFLEFDEENRSCLGGALTIYLLSYLLAVQLSNSRQNLANKKNLEALVIAKDTNQAVINPNASSLKSSSKESSKMAPAIKLTRALRFFNIMLATNLIFLSNDVALNPGPIDLRVSSEGGGITIGQWNIQHLKVGFH